MRNHCGIIFDELDRMNIICNNFTENVRYNNSVTELFWHPSIENRFAMGRMPAGSAFSYGLCSECTDLVYCNICRDITEERHL